MSEDKFNCETVSFETENIGNGTVLKCINAGDDVELVSTWFAHEEDANLWKSFLEHMANTIIHSVKFSEEQRDALIAERDALKNERDALSSKLDLVKNSIKTMFDSIVVDEPTVVKKVQEPVVEKKESPDGSVISFDSLDMIDQGRYYKILGYNSAETMRQVKGLHETLKDPENPSFMELCTEKDDVFVGMFGRPLFKSNNYMSSSVRAQVKTLVKWLCSHKLNFIRKSLEEQPLHEVADALKVHPVYIWAVCVGYEIPFVNDYLPNLHFDGEKIVPGNTFAIPINWGRKLNKVNLVRAYKILGYDFDETTTAAEVGNLNVLLDKFQLNWRKLGTDEDRYADIYCGVYPFEDGDDYSIESCVAVRKFLMGYIDDIIQNAYDWGIERLAKAFKIPIHYVWAFCMVNRINFTAKNYHDNAIHAFVFEEP